MGHFGPLFHFLSFQYTMFNKNLADNWIQTADLWCWKQLLYHLSHNHCPEFNLQIGLIAAHEKIVNFMCAQLHKFLNKLTTLIGTVELLSSFLVHRNRNPTGIQKN